MKFILHGPIGEDRTIEFDENQMLVREARELKKVTGLGLRQFGEGMRDGDIDALMGMIYLALRREGIAIRWKDLDEFNINDLEVDDAEQRAAEAAAAAADADDDPDADGLAVVRAAPEVVVGELMPASDGTSNGAPPRPTPAADLPAATP